MRKILILTLTLIANYTFAQTNLEHKQIERKGFVIGLGLGAGVLTLNTNNTTNVTFSTTLPNIKVGYMLNERFALLALLPGANYKYQGKDRGFEGLIIAGQYWLIDNWWLLGGAGLTFDAPAFYTVKDPKTANFYTGLPAFTFTTGYEVWHKGRFALDLQYRIFLGKSNLPNNGQREGLSNMFIVGFNWY
ncbi:MAG: hypothetical protein COA99_12395 [Moraxellaceae bacterium]|nr:MAG: hypothetical protein COA99_12395 [Moraxellaceae bacterium]